MSDGKQSLTQQTVQHTMRYTMQHMARCTVMSALLVAVAPHGQAAMWAGANVNTQGAGGHVGISLLDLPILGPMGVEASLEKLYNDTPMRLAAGVTWRDFSLPLIPLDVFVSAGLAYEGAVSTAVRPDNSSPQGPKMVFNTYGEAGLRGPVFGPVGWRAFTRVNSVAQFSAGIGIEVRF